MKLKFKNQDFQNVAVNAVCDLFRGQKKRRDTFDIVNESQFTLLDGVGVRNVLDIDNEQITENMQEVQTRHSLPLTVLDSADESQARHFCIEMETGTGKTYVYTNTIFELNKQYGFTKFIIVVPSVAIREGVFTSFKATQEHFANLYDNVPVRWFIYDSKKLSQVRLFATSSDIEIMIINIDAFKKAENIINQVQDRLTGDTAMGYIQNSCPIVIIDEPQSVDNTSKAKEAIASLNPLFVLRYSATHKQKINLLYRLTPVDAYQMGLVKQICVSSNEIESDYNRPYIRLVSVSNKNGFSANIEIDKKGRGIAVERKIVSIKADADIFKLSGERELYRGYNVVGIDCTAGNEGIEFSDGQFLHVGEAFGNVDENVIKRSQIRRTVETHLEKELRYIDKGIKILSLFFIDEVAKYRKPDGSKGLYADMFEQCYLDLINLPKFVQLKNKFSSDVGRVHDGYFSQDKKGVLKNTRGDTLDDYGIYNTIMKDKEWLLSFACPLRFIFSHSTLKEGWDNPNVFQVCTLLEQKAVFTARQKVGRGLRLCVNQDGERVEDRNVNVLHVMASESFAEFADNLQREIEQETGLKFGVLDWSSLKGWSFATSSIFKQSVGHEQAKTILDYVKASEKGDEKPIIATELNEIAQKVVQIAKTGEEVTVENIASMTYEKTEEYIKTISSDDLQELFLHFEKKNYINKDGVIKDKLKVALQNKTIDLPQKFEAAREKIEFVIAKADIKPPIENHAKEVKVKIKKQVMVSEGFLSLWNKIKGKTSYRICIDENILKQRAIAKLSEIEPVSSAKIVTRTARFNVEKSGITFRNEYERAQSMTDVVNRLPNFIRMVDDECFISRRTAIEILTESGRVVDFINNPQKMTEIFIDVLRSVQSSMEIDGISYKRLDGDEYYLQEIFDSEELIGYLDKNAVFVDNSLYDHILYDSTTVERPFAIALDNDPDVKMFFKIPDKFKIQTPIGTYNPDWAVYLDKDGVEKLYFVLETKGVSGSIAMENLRPSEKQKIICGKKHFEALSNDVVFPANPVKDWFEFKRSL